MTEDARMRLLARRKTPKFKTPFLTFSGSMSRCVSEATEAPS